MNRTIHATNYLILAMREKWMNLIFSGEKTVEVRRTCPASLLDFLDYLYLYNRGCVHGIAKVSGFAFPKYCGRVEMHDCCCKACLTQAEMNKYIDGARSPIIYIISRAQRFDTPIPVLCRPQSWQYATPELLDIINGKELK